MTKCNACLPVNFDWKAHLKKNPPKINNFKEWKIFYILDLLNRIPANKKDIITSKGYIPIKAKYLQDKIKDYTLYLSYLCDTEILESDNQYIIGEKSIGYRYSPQFFSQDIIIQDIGIKMPNFRVRMDKHPIEKFKYSSNELSKRKWLTYWYNTGDLNIDYESALIYSKEIRDKKINGEMAWDLNKDKNCYKNPTTQYHASIYNIEKFNNEEYNLIIDASGGRLHSVMTNMQKDFRHFIKYKGEKLISIDIKNSQPYLLNLILNPNFWIKSTLPVTINSLSINLPTSPKSIMIGQIIDNIDKQEIDAWVKATGEGKIYEMLMQEAKNRNIILTRDEAKTMFLKVLYSSNAWFHQPDASLKKIFGTSIFPEIYKLLEFLKEEDYKFLACLMQHIESKIVLDHICKRVWIEGKHKIPVFTIHDSIATTEENKDFVEKIMIEELTRCVGVKPTLSIEKWSQTAL